MLICSMRNQNRSQKKEIWVCEFTFLEMKKDLTEAERLLLWEMFAAHWPSRTPVPLHTLAT